MIVVADDQYRLACTLLKNRSSFCSFATCRDSTKLPDGLLSCTMLYCVLARSLRHSRLEQSASVSVSAASSAEE